MVHNNEESCGSFAQNPDDKKNVRFNSGLFLFLKGTIEDLKSSPISIMRLQYGNEHKDYVISKELTSTLTKKVEQPEQLFIANMHCIE